MPKCSFCEKNYENPRGTTVVNSESGIVKYYCSSKCRKNAEMKRKKRQWAKPTKAEEIKEAQREVEEVKEEVKPEKEEATKEKSKGDSKEIPSKGKEEKK